MAFVSKVGNLLKQSGGNHVSMGLSSSNSLFFQAIRSMSSAKIFVGGLSCVTDEVGLREAFQQYGEVIDAKVIIDRDSGRSRGFGFVSYTSADAANNALQDMDGKDLHGRRVRVSFAQETPSPSCVGGGSGGGGDGGSGGYAGSGGYSDINNNLGGYGGRNQNAGRLDNFFGSDLGGGSGFFRCGGDTDWNLINVLSGKNDRDDLDENLNPDLSGKNDRDDLDRTLNHDLSGKNDRDDLDRTLNHDLSGKNDRDDLDTTLNHNLSGKNDGNDFDWTLNHNLSRKDDRDDFEDDEYRDTSEKCVLM